MKRKIYLPLFVAILTLAGCANDPLEVPVSQTETNTIENPDYEIIRSLGLQTDDIVENDDFYVVEGDIVISKEHVDEIRNESKTRQAKYSVTVNSTTVQNIKVYIDPALGSSWSQAVTEALNEWSNIANCTIGFSTVSSSSSANVVVKRNSGITGNTIAQAYYPQGNRPGTPVEVGFNFDTRSASFKKDVMVHEFGHVLGFVHTNWKSDSNSTSGTHIIGTPDQNDSNSVMNYIARGAWTGFSQGDIAAAQVLYGIPIWSREITGLAISPSENPPAYTLNIGTNLINLSVAWYVNGVQYGSSNPLSFAPKSLPTGQVTLKAVVKYDGTNYETSKIISVFNTSISGPDSPTRNTNATYSVPTALPSGVSFVGWTPVAGATSGNWNSTSLTVKFTANGSYTLKANFRLPNGSTVTSQKVISVGPPPKPVIVSMGGGTQRVYEPYLSRISPLRDPLMFWVLTGGNAHLNVDNYERDDTTYEWQGQLGSGQTTGFGDTAIVIPTPMSYGSCYEVQCRAKRNGVYSDWTTFYLYVNTSLPSY